MRQLLIRLTLLLLVAASGYGQEYAVGEKTISLTDSTRNRPVTIELWYPTNETDPKAKRKTDLPFLLPPTIRNAVLVRQKAPLVVFSHGSGGNRFSLAWLAIALARQGYVVAAPDHWGGTFDNLIPAYYIRYWERPLDISFVVTALLTDQATAPFLDSARIGAVGYSFGGYTSLALAGADIDCAVLKRNARTKDGKREFAIPQLGDLRKLIDTIACPESQTSVKDNRIKSVVALAPGLGLGYERDQQTQPVTAPVLIIAAADDQVAPLRTNAAQYHRLIPSSEYLLLEEKTGHYVFLNEADDPLRKEAKQLFVDDKKVNRKTVHQTVEANVLRFFNQTLAH